MNQILTFMEQVLLPSLKEIMHVSKKEFMNKPINKLAAERCFHLIIEAMTDIGNLLIDGFIMRDPGSYEDIVDIMEDERVYTKAHARMIKEIVMLRKELVVNYTENIHDKLYETYINHYEIMELYPSIIRQYLLIWEL